MTRRKYIMIHFPFFDYWWFYLGFTAFVLVVLALDLGVFHKNAHEVGFKEVEFPRKSG